MELLTKIAGMVLLIAFLGMLLSLPIWLLWNGCLVPAVNGVNEIGWLQAWGLNILCTGLFKGVDVKTKA